MKKYTKTHEWIELSDGTGTVGITNYAQEKLGDVVYVELPDVGKKVKKGEAVLTVESVKAASDVYSPADGEVVEVNETLNDNPGLINEDPEGKGWIFKIKVENPSQLDELLSEEEYKKFCEEEGE
ncbi:MAG: glycine cleavage system protein H [Thermotoga sp. 4484_232]|nr:MAG: glycine cleavage system protein H [Thermotoga sp. 4484_232]RKX53740.1 MAG: glycine cleavage system protein GcvH [Thermotoga sp.]